MPIHRIIAIDGPAASGKSSVAGALAQRLGFSHVNSGAMYRAVTWHVLQRGVNVHEPAAIAAAVEKSRVVCHLLDNRSRILIDGHDPTPHLRDDDVNRAVSLVSSVPRVREILVAHMREYAKKDNVVMEGRDIGSIVFPETPFKFYIDASPEVRVQRRLAEGQRDEIAARDRADSSRVASPLVIAPDAMVIDTSALTIDGVVDQIMRRLVAKGLPAHSKTGRARRQRMNPYYWLGYWLSRLLAQILFRFRILHRERMIQSGPVILAMNHQSFFDPPLAGNASNRAIFFLARKTLLDHWFWGWLLPKLNVIPVDQEGSDRSALKALIRILRAGEATLVFPEGGRTLDGNLQPAQPGIGLVIAKTLAPVVPMRIFGAHQAWPRGSNKIRLHPITIVVGRPIFFTQADIAERGKDVYQRLSERVMNGIAKLTIDGNG
jgi:cytidylate kinase